MRPSPPQHVAENHLQPPSPRGFSRCPLALGKAYCAQIEPVEIEQIEGVVEQPILAARGEIGVQQPEIRDTARIRDDSFAIQDQVVRRQDCEGIGDRLEAQRV
jgi:hypothetical protein